MKIARLSKGILMGAALMATVAMISCNNEEKAAEPKKDSVAAPATTDTLKTRPPVKPTDPPPSGVTADSAGTK